jgi:hypothetical protein
MFRRAAALKAKQQQMLRAKAKRSNPVNRSGAEQRINSRQDLRDHITRENE